MVRCSLHIKNVLSVISLPICPHLIKADIQSKKKNPTTLRPRDEAAMSGFISLHLIHLKAGVTLSEGGSFCWDLRQGGTSGWRYSPA